MKKIVCITTLLFVCTLANSQENLFVVEDSITGLKGCMNLSKELVVPYEYEELDYMGDGFFVTAKKSKVGMIDSLGRVCIPNIYGYGGLVDTDNELFYLPKDGKYGLIDFKNNVLIPFQYDDIYIEQKNDILKVKKNGKFGLISLRLKKEIVPCKYDRIKMGMVLFDNGIVRLDNERPSDLMAVLNNSKWGFVDLDGNITIPCKYEDVSQLGEDGSEQFDPSRYYYVFQGGRTPFVKNGKVGLLDEKGNIILQPIYKHIDMAGFNNSVDYPTATTFNNKQVLIDHNNNVVSKEYDEIEAVDEDFAVYKSGLKYGLIRLPDCKVITDAKYDGFRYASEGYIRYEVNGKYGYINKAGQEVFKPEYDDGEGFHNGYCSVKKDGKYGYIKAYGYSGTYIDCQFDEGGYFDDSGIAIVRKNGLYGAINTMKKNLIPFEFDKIERYVGKGFHKVYEEDGFYRVRKGKQYGYYNNRGQMIVPCKYSEEKCEIEKRLYIAQSTTAINNDNSTYGAYELVVKSIEVARNDLSARTNGRNDLNGIPCALVRVVLKDSDPLFEGSIIGDTKRQGMQYLLFMPAGSKYLRVVPADYMPLMVSFSDYGIKALESQKTYDLIIVAKPH